MPELTPADRVLALLEWGDVAEADAEIEGSGGWQGSLWRGTRALMEGRFVACERFAAETARLGGDAAEPRVEFLAGVLSVALLREQERVAEAEIMLRTLIDRYPSAPASAHALLALLIGEMGRDSQAQLELSRLMPRDPVAATGRLALLFLLGELAAAVEAPPDELDLLYRRLRPHATDFAVDESASACYGSVAFALGRLAQARGRWQDAAGHYDDAVAAHERIGAPLLLAHTQRHLAALLRMHGEESDWDRAVALLSSAASIYSHLGVDGRAAEAQAVLARSAEGLSQPRGRGDEGDEAVFRRQGDAWEIGPAAATVRLRDSKGIQDIARLLAAPHASVHVADLLGSPTTAFGPRRPTTALTGAGERRWGAMPAQWDLAEPVLDAATRDEYDARLAELASELVEAERASDGVRAALARAERDSLAAALAGDGAGDPLERARHAVVTRIRISLDRIEQAEPAVGRHLRGSIRTGTFCAYEPDHQIRWRL